MASNGAAVILRSTAYQTQQQSMLGDRVLSREYVVGTTSYDVALEAVGEVGAMPSRQRHILIIRQ